MVSVNPLEREIQLKIVYYGPGLGGKTTTLQYIHRTTNPEHRGKMVSLATPVERTLYFDYLPVRLPAIGGYTLKLQLFTVPGQVHFNATRKLVLSNADGVVFVADSQQSRYDANLESFDNLITNLQTYKIAPDKFPLVFHYNKRDLDGVMSILALESALNKRGCPSLGTCAMNGENIYEGLELITKEVLRDLKRRDVLARQDRPHGGILEEKLEFKKVESGLEDQVQAISERIARSRIASPPDGKKLVDPPLEKPLPALRDTDPPSNLPLAVDRPTIPAPFALTEKVVSEKQRSELSKVREKSKDKIVSTPPGFAVSQFSFAPIWPEIARNRASKIESAISQGHYKDAVRLVSHELDIIVTHQARGLPRSSAQTIIALLGLDGRQYLEITKLAFSPEENLSDKAALNAYLFLLQAIDRSKEGSR